MAKNKGNRQTWHSSKEFGESMQTEIRKLKIRIDCESDPEKRMALMKDLDRKKDLFTITRRLFGDRYHVTGGGDLKAAPRSRI